MGFPVRTPSSLRSVVAPDEMIFRRAQAGNEHAWATLRDRYAGTLARHLRQRTGDPTATRDVVARALEEARVRLVECGAAKEFPLWLRRVADGVVDAHNRHV